MQPEKWKKIEQIFNEAAALEGEKQTEFVEQKADGDKHVRDTVLRLLVNDSREKFFIDEPVFTLGSRLMADAEDEELIKNGKFAHFRLQKIIGRGGMGVVFLAQDTRLNRRVALKLLPESLDRHHETITRFRQEAHAASNVAHPNFAHIYDFGKLENRYFLAMEYVPGKTLRELLKEKLIDTNKAFDIAQQIAAALQTAHKSGIVHRDIKPENIVVMNDGLVKVLDFGLAKLTQTENAESFETSLETVPGLIMGTTGYMSPEQVRGMTVDRTTDIWSLGIVFYEMLTGRRPFEAETASDVRAAILRDAFPPVSAKVRHHRDFNNFLTKVLAKDRLERPQTATDFLIGLQTVRNKFDGKGSSFTGQIRNWRILRPVFALTAFLALLFSTYFYFGNDKSIRHTSPETIQTTDHAVESIAILPFTNETGAEELKLVSLGIAEDLSRGLGKRTDLQVISFASARKIENAYDLQNVKEKLNVEAVMRGKISGQNNKLTIAVELVELDTNEILWREQIGANGNDLLKLRNALTAVIATNFKFSGQATKNLILSDHATRNNEAYKLYLEGKYAADRSTAEGTRRAVEKLKQAVKLDPEYALALVALGDGYNLLAAWFGENPKFYFPLAAETLNKAIALDPELSEAHTTLAKMKMDYERDFLGAEREFQKAIELNPNNSLAHHWYGEVYLSAMGRLDESLHELEIARRLNPLSSGILTALAWTYIGRKEYKKAIIECDKAIAVNPSDNSSYSFKAMALMKLKRYDEAIATMKNAEADDGESLEQGVIYALNGQTEKTRDYLRRLETARRDDISDYDIAVLYAALGEKDKVFQLLERETRSKSVDLLSIRIDPLLDTLRDDPRFAEIEKKLNLPEIR